MQFFGIIIPWYVILLIYFGTVLLCMYGLLEGEENGYKNL